MSDKPKTPSAVFMDEDCTIIRHPDGLYDMYFEPEMFDKLVDALVRAGCLDPDYSADDDPGLSKLFAAVYQRMVFAGLAPDPSPQ